MTRGSCLRIGSSARAKGLADRPSHTNSTLEGSHIAGVDRPPDLAKTALSIGHVAHRTQAIITGKIAQVGVAVPAK